MACIKVVNRSASVALAPDAPYMAAGTMAGAVDLSFSSSASLEIFKLDFQSEDHDLQVVVECPSSERFNRISWGKNGSGSDDFALGMIAGGLVDGSIDIWNPLSLIRSEGSEKAPVGHLSRHKGPVRGLEFNGITPNLLASGADDGEIAIWDLASPAEPSHFPPLKGSGSAAQGEISFVSWNSKVQHILASTSYSGTTVVWDLKKQKPVISFADSVRRRCSVLQWNPDLATQLVVASDEDSSPSLRLWDMRNTMSPVREFVGHTKGVIAMSWCPFDSNYLLTCAKDNRTICWDTVTGEIVCELPAGTNWNFDVHWYPKIPGVISASSFDGKIAIYNIEGCSRYAVGEDNFGTAPLRAPKWYKRPVGASFGFGGKLVSFRARPSAVGARSTSEVFVHDLVTEQNLVSRSSEFQSAIQNGERSSLRVFCERKSQESEVEDDRETWGFLKVMFEDDGTARTKLLTHLGFSLPSEEKGTMQDDHAQVANAVISEDKVTYEPEKEENIFSADTGEDFFNNLPSPKADTPVSSSVNDFTAESAAPSVDQVPQESDGLEEKTDTSFDDAVQRALVVGDYKGAVALCMSISKMADALVIAHVGGGSLWENTRDQYLKTCSSPYLKIVSAMVNNDLTVLVNSRPLRFWKETLALLCTFAQREEWMTLCDTLASKLMAAGYTLPATLCYICAGNIDKTVEIWSSSLTNDHEGKTSVDLLQDLMEKTIVLALATGQKQFSAALCKLVEKYAEILASQGLVTTAVEYLKLLASDELSPELVMLKDRISLLVLSDTNFGPVSEPNPQPYLNGPTSQVQPSVPRSGYDSNNTGLYSSYSGYSAPAQFQPQAQPTPAQFQPQAQPTPSQFQPQAQPTPAQFQPQAQPTPSQFQPQAQPTPAQFQPQAQPTHMFVPSQAPNVGQGNFSSPAPSQTQPPVRPFIPSSSPVLRNPEQYQQPPTLGSQLYPVASNPTYPGPSGASTHAPVPAQVASAPSTRSQISSAQAQGFMPVNNAAVAQSPMMGSKPGSPTHSSAQPVVAPPAPPPTVQTADTSKVAAQHSPVVMTLTRLFSETSEALGGPRAQGGKRREIEDNSKKIGALFVKLNNGDISKNASDKLIQLCQALDSNDFATALQIQVLLTTSEWDECNFWLATLKRMIKTKQSMR